MSTLNQPMESLPEFLARTVLQHRLLIIVFASTIAIGIWEFSRRAESVSLQLAQPVNFTDVMAELYPDDAGVQHMKALQLTLCMEAMRAGRTPPSPCSQYADVDQIETVRGFYEQGIASSKHNEDLFYEYVMLLRATNAGQDEIAAAAEAWRRSFPLSERPDPRTLSIPTSQESSQPLVE